MESVNTINRVRHGCADDYVTIATGLCFVLCSQYLHIGSHVLQSMWSSLIIHNHVCYNRVQTWHHDYIISQNRLIPRLTSNSWDAWKVCVHWEPAEVDVTSTAKHDFCNSCQGNVLLQTRNDILSEPACLKVQPSEIERENGRAWVWDKIRR